MTTPCFLRARPEEEKGEGVSGRDGRRKHAGEKRGGSCKDPSVPRHRVFVIGGRGEGEKLVVLIPRGLGFCTCTISLVEKGTISLVEKKKKGGEPLKLNTAHDRRSKVSEPCIFATATWDCVPSGTFVSLVEVSFVHFPN